jgi:cellulose synthase/poly-beta-1,6-N-acetylglucosamine synthase-like glycosyltransferase
MNQTQLLVVALVPLALLAWSYVGYPAVLWALQPRGRRRAPAAQGPRRWPTVSVLVAAYNEEPVIAARLENLASLDYPARRLEILVGSDGSTDRTAAIAQAYASRTVRVFGFPRRRGKASVLNDLAARARGEVLVLTDANCQFAPDAVRELVMALWRGRDVCAAVGRLHLRPPAGSGNAEGLYWGYESWVKRLESSYGAVLGANGAIYAVRRAQYVPLPAEAIIDDFLEPLLIRRRWGGHVVFVPAAVAWETAPERMADEFRRRSRIGSGDVQALRWTWPLLLPGHGVVALAYLSHKVIRWFGPWLLLLALAGSVALAMTPGASPLLLGAHLGVYGLALAAPAARRVPGLGPLATAIRYFVAINAGLLAGSIRFALGRARPYWTTVARHEVA